MPDVDSTPVYREVPDFDGYEVTRDGRMRSIWAAAGTGVKGERKRQKEWKYLNPGINCNGYLIVSMRRNDGKRMKVLLHRIVLMTFKGPCPHGMIGCHRDDDKENNNIENLYYGTYVQNNRDAVRNGKRPIGENNANSKLTDNDIRIMFKMRLEGYKLDYIANRFNVSKGMVSNILNRKTWSHVEIIGLSPS
jgi:hypothetical protein